MKILKMIPILGAVLLLAGCSSPLEKPVVEDVDHLTLGHSLTINHIDSSLTLVDNNSALAAEGLYYASWGMGDSVPYENSDGDTVDLYDASLYLLLGESKDGDAAKTNRDTWYEAAKTSYDLLSEEELSCNGLDYTLITYNCASESNPYARGISAFGVFDNAAVCVELTCREEFDQELQPILNAFLENCSVITD